MVDNTFRVLRASVALRLTTTDAEGRFYGTERLATLRKDAPRSLRPVAISFTDAGPWQSWIGFVSAVRSGPSKASAAKGSDFFAHWEHNQRGGAEFSAAMGSTTSLWSYNIADVIDTTNVRRVVDVGGASGALVRLLQRANPGLHAVVFDRPVVVEQTRADIAQFGFPERTDVVGGDFFGALPQGDLYLLKFILHDWDDQSCIEILRQCRRAALPGARIAIIEFLVGDLANPGLMATLSDIAMLALLNGRERTLEEFDSLLAAAGLCRTSVRPTVSPQSVIEATIV